MDSLGKDHVIILFQKSVALHFFVLQRLEAGGALLLEEQDLLRTGAGKASLPK